ncbi:uncharacterized protein PG998_007971 [Apiospora kogelbergensis]|uniref:uncharacterized protein n=1 Tax=Apiospora kogelbergensis TaxID=1337665 RepID=UPI00313184BB
MCFEKSEVPLNHDVPSLTLETIQTKFNPQWCNEIRTQASQVHEAVVRSWRCQCNDHQASLKLLWHEDQLLKPPGEFHVAVCSTDGPGGDVSWQEIIFEQADSNSQDLQSLPQVPEPIARQGNTIKAWFRPSFDIRDKHLEMRQSSSLSPSRLYPYDRTKKSSGHVNTEEGPTAELTHGPDADCLCSFLHKKDRHARLLLSGTGESLSIRKGLGKAPQATTMTPIRTVLDAKTRQRSDEMPLSRRDRFALAAAATWAVLYLAESPWIAGRWDADPELYLLSEHHSCVWRHCPSLSSILPKGPCSEVTLAVDENSEASGPYPSIVRNKTLFALGVLLIELCLDKPFEKLRQDYHGGNLSAPLGTGLPASDYEIANQSMQKVYLEAGDFYGYAVQRCLRCEFPGRDITKNFQFEQFRRDFFSHVIAPVQATYALLPSSVSAL